MTLIPVIGGVFDGHRQDVDLTTWGDATALHIGAKDERGALLEQTYVLALVVPSVLSGAS